MCISQNGYGIFYSNDDSLYEGEVKDSLAVIYLKSDKYIENNIYNLTWGISFNI